MPHTKEYRHKFDLVWRGRSALEHLGGICPALKKGGKLIAIKEKAFEEIQETTNALKIMGGEIEDKLNTK